MSSSWKAAMAAALGVVVSTLLLVGGAAAQTTLPNTNMDVAGRDVWLMPNSRLRFGESLLSRRYLTNGVLPLKVTGRGMCSAVACPVTFNGQDLYGRRLRLSLTDPGAGANTGNCREVATITRTLRRGDRGSDVEVLQRCLNSRGAGLEVDGNYGRGTREAVRDFQTGAGIGADGVFGPLTRQRLAQL